MLKNKIVLNFIILVFAFMSSFSAFGENTEEANAAYQRGDYQEAIQKYKILIKMDVVSYEIYNNMGLAYSQLDSLGNARLYFEKALKLNNSANVKHNIEVVKNRLEDSFIEVKPFFLLRWVKSVGSFFMPNVWVILCLVFSLMAFSFFYWMKKNTEHALFNKKWQIIGALLLFSLISFGLSIASKNRLTDAKSAIVVKSKVDVKKGADINASLFMELHEGTKVVIVDQIGEWYKVRLPNGETGWLQLSDFLVI